MRRLFILTVIMGLICFMGSSALAKDAAWYRQHGVTVVNPPDFSPMSFVGLNGEPKGYIVDLWKRWSEKTGVPVRFRFELWQETLRLVADGECEFHGGLFKNEERAKYLSFSNPFNLIESALMVVREKDTALDTIYEDYSIGVLTGGYAQYFMSKHHPESKLVPLPSMADLATGLVDGTIDALVGDHPVMGYEVGKLGKAKSLLVKEIVYTQPLYGATAKGNDVLVQLANDGFSAISERERDHLFERWFVTEAEDNHWLRDSLILLAVLLAGVFIFVFYDSKKTRASEDVE